MNRYSRVAPSQFNPLSLQEVMAVPLARQQNHDNTMAQIDKLGLFDINRLQQDEEQASGFINDYTDKLSGQADQIMQGGVDQNTMREMMKLKSERDKFLLNDGKKMQTAYDEYQKNEELVNKMISQGMSGERAAEILNQAKSGYEGIKKGPYQSYYGARESDVGKYMQDAVEKLDKSKFVRESGLENAGNGYLKVTKESMKSINPIYVKDGKIHQDDLVKTYAYNRAMASPEIQADLAHMKRVNPDDSRFQPDQNGFIPYLEQQADSTNYAYSAIERDINSQYLKDPEASSGSGRKPKAEDGSIFENDGQTDFFTKYGDLSTLKKGAKAGDKRAESMVKQFEQRFQQSDYYKRKQQAIVSDIMEQTNNELSYEEVTQLVDQDYARPRRHSNGKYYIKEPVTNKVVELNNEYLQYQVDNLKNVNSPEEVDYKNIFTDDGVVSNYKGLKAGRYIGSINDNDLQDIETYKSDMYEKFAAPETTYMFEGLNPTERKNMNVDLKNTLYNAVNNYELLELQATNFEGKNLDAAENFYDEDSNDSTKLNISTMLDSADAIDLVNTGVDNRTNLPYVRVRFKRNDDEGKEETYTLKVGIDKQTGKSGVQSGESKVIRLLEDYGGQDGKNVAKRMKQRVMYQDENINYKQDVFNETSDYVKNNLMSNNMTKKFESTYGKDFKINLYQDESGQHVLQSKSKDAKNGDFVSWADVASPTNVDVSNVNMDARDRSIQTALLQYAITNNVIDSTDIIKDGRYNVEAINQAFNDILANPQLHKVALNDKYLLYDMLKDY
tara:strand:+ start:11237 stop:13591 length:2355 start_codon:yes stop_codon:yes gene_type:complete